MANIPQFIGGVIGGLNDTKKSLRVLIVDSAGTAVDLTGATVKLFATGAASGDKPSSLQASGCTFGSGATAIVSAAAFSGVTVGMVVTCPGFLQTGTTVTVVTDSSHITLSLATLAANPTGGMTLSFAIGITGTIVSPPTAGIVDFPALGNLCNIGTLAEDTYAYVVDVQGADTKHSLTVPVANFKITRSTK